jgi:polyhydroxyalkanoate synthesis regulator phasin
VKVRSINRKVILAVGAAVASLALFGAVAFASFTPDTSSTVDSLLGPNNVVAAADTKVDKLKALLDGLVAKGVITQAQENAILDAIKDAAARGAKVEAVVRDFLGESATYLGISGKDLKAKLPGTSLAAIANATPGKSRDGLVADLVKAGNADIDKAVANKKITDDQAKKLRDALPGRVATFVDRTWPKPRAVVPNVKSFLGDLAQAGQSYLGLPLADIRTQLASGKSLGDIANATPGKSRDGLVAALVNAANARIDQAVTDKKITADQATALKSKVSTEIARFVDREAPAKANTKPTTTSPTSTTPKP